MEIDSVIFQVLESFGKERLSNWLWKSFGFLFWKILKYPKMEITWCRIKHRICYIFLFYYL